MAVKIT